MGTVILGRNALVDVRHFLSFLNYKYHRTLSSLLSCTRASPTSPIIDCRARVELILGGGGVR